MRNVSDKFYCEKIKPYFTDIRKCLENGFGREDIASYLEISTMSLRRARKHRPELEALWQYKKGKKPKGVPTPKITIKKSVVKEKPVDKKSKAVYPNLLRNIFSFIKTTVEEYDDDRRTIKDIKRITTSHINWFQQHTDIYNGNNKKIEKRFQQEGDVYNKNNEEIEKRFVKIEDFIKKKLEKTSEDNKTFFEKYLKILVERIEVLEKRYDLQEEVDDYIKQEINEK